MTIRTFAFIALLSILSSCDQKKPCPSTIVLLSTSRTPTVGDDITLSVPVETINNTFQWYGPGISSTTNQSNKMEIRNIQLSDAGVYNCGVGGNGDCNPLSDTILIDVKLQQETPPCSLTNNFISFNSIPSPTYTSVTKSYSNNSIILSGYGGFGYPNIEVVFNSYNGNSEPRDGTHTSTDIQVFDPFDEPNEVSISFVYQGTYFHSRAGNKVYVSHVNGKLQVSFCNLTFGGASNTVTCSGKMTQL